MWVAFVNILNNEISACVEFDPGCLSCGLDS